MNENYTGLNQQLYKVCIYQAVVAVVHYAGHLAETVDALTVWCLSIHPSVLSFFLTLLWHRNSAHAV